MVTRLVTIARRSSRIYSVRGFPSVSLVLEQSGSAQCFSSTDASSQPSKKVKGYNFRKNGNKDNNNSEEAEEAPIHHQPFVTTKIEPGEWDWERTDPLHRPKYRSNAKIISAEDFAARSRVSFEDQFNSYADSMTTLSWMNKTYHKRIYQLYLGWMFMAHERFGKTSHEYVCRLLAQKFDITPFRVAAIIQLQHNEEQIKQNEPNRQLLTEESIMIDMKINETIKECYRVTRETPPDAFVEDPIGVSQRQESKKTVIVDDVFDMVQLMEDATIREKDRAHMIIDQHTYVEDVDQDQIPIEISPHAMKLVSKSQELKAGASTSVRPDPSLGDQPLKPLPEHAKGKRPRFQYVLQAIHTREPTQGKNGNKGKKMGKGDRNTFRQNFPENTLIEEDGEVRVATMADVRKTSWKPVRHLQEFTYAGVKQGWLDKVVRKKQNSWGKKPVFEGTKPSEQVASGEAKNDEADTKDEAESVAASAETSTENETNDSEQVPSEEAQVNEEEETEKKD